MSVLLAWAARTPELLALLGVFVSLYGVYWQTQKQWLLQSASMVTDLVDKFNLEDFLEHRKACAELIARHRAGESVSLVGNYGFGVLGFFEHVGHLVRRGALDDHMVWNKFGWEILGYHSGLTFGSDLIGQLRSNLTTHYVEFEWLHSRMVTLYVKHGDHPYAVDSAGRSQLTWMTEFMQQELGPRPKQQLLLR